MRNMFIIFLFIQSINVSLASENHSILLDTIQQVANLDAKVSIKKQEVKIKLDEANAKFDEYEAYKPILKQAKTDQGNKAITVDKLSQVVEKNNKLVAEIKNLRAEHDGINSEIDKLKQDITVAHKRTREIRSSIILNQITNTQQPLEEASTSDRNRLTIQAYEVDLSPIHCQMRDEKRKELRKQKKPDWRSLMIYNSLCGVNTYYNQENNLASGFQLTSNYSKDINPKGSFRANSPSYRQFTFNFKDQTKTNMHLMILDNARTSGRASRDEMYKTIILIPRLHTPAVAINKNNPCIRDVTLQTGELVQFHALTSKIISGVLSEEAIDYSTNRSSRKDPLVSYTGKGISISVSRRGAFPNRVFKDRWNEHDTLTHASVKYKDKHCWIKKELLWTNVFTEEGDSNFRYSSDEELIDKVLNPTCGWNISLEDLT